MKNTKHVKISKLGESVRHIKNGNIDYLE